ncbi:MAG: AMP-binding protein, partial [Clostridia bacterium]|nr:AMP-binding protein [Clostridia bacterium]
MIRNINNDIDALNAARDKAYGLGPLRSIRDLFDRVSVCYAGRDCVVERDGDEFIVRRTDELCADVRALGAALIAKSLRGAHIGVIGENSYSFLIVLLATVCIGSVAVPLDKELTASDHAALLERADASVVFSAKKY